MDETHAKFSVGQLVHHRRFDYRGVIFDVDPTFQGTRSGTRRSPARARPRTGRGTTSCPTARSTPPTSPSAISRPTRAQTDPPPRTRPVLRRASGRPLPGQDRGALSPRPTRARDIEVLGRESAYRGFSRLDRYRLRHRLFAGGFSGEIVREVLAHAPTVAVLPYDPALGSVVLIEQFPRRPLRPRS